MNVLARRRKPVAFSDSQLMARMNAGRPDALGELYDRYCARAYRVAFSVCRDQGHAEDAVQNAFLSIWKSPSAYREQRGSVAAWLLSIVRYRAIDVTRAHATYTSRLDAEDSLAARPSPDDTAEQVGAIGEREQMLALLDALPDAQREVITLAFYGGLSHTEIAQHLELPAGTVKGRMRLGLDKLRAHVEPDERSAHASSNGRPSARANPQPKPWS